jgi:Zn-dependent protease
VPVLSRMASMNLILVVLNLIPVPPLDGHSAICAFIPEVDGRRWQRFVAKSHFQFIGIIIAWYIFGAIFQKVFFVYLKILHPLVTYQAV